MGESQRFDVQSRLDEIDKRVMDGLTPFQRATVERIADIYAGNQRRVLVADEVGLGKTLIARGVVSKIAKLRNEEHDDLVKIAYICSNGAIAAQNIAKLAIDGDVKLAPADASRLSMQHLAVARERGDEELKRRYIQITPLTPSTSFSVSTGKGTLYERALMLAVLLYDERFKRGSGRGSALARLLWAHKPGYSKDSWKYWKWRANDEVARARKGDPGAGVGVGYPYDVVEKVAVELEIDGETTLSGIADYLDAGKRDQAIERRIIINLRKAFAKACVDMLDPDFVIMDEFQRFHELVANSESETAMLAKRFFGGDTRVLLLSATPFRLFSTTAELDTGGFGDSYREFLEVMGFLNENDTVREQEFTEIWGRYTVSLQKLGAGACDVISIRHAKSQAEASVRKSMARTERQSTGELGPIADNRSHRRELSVTERDVQAYVRMREIAEAAGIPRGLMQADFAKSCPFPLSFMSRYKFFQKLKSATRKKPEIVKADKKYDDGLLWLRRWDVASYSKITVDNARYRAFIEDLTSQPGLKLEQLLWVPPSRPYYRVPQDSPFSKAGGFSKFLLFSAWSMVPPALATLLSYEFERRNVLTLQGITGKSYRYFKDEGEDGEGVGEDRDDQALPYRRMRFDRDQHNAFLLLYPSRYLASLIDVSELANGVKSLNDVRRTVKSRIRKDLVDVFKVRRLPKSSEASARRSVDWYIMALLKLDEAHGYDVMGELLDGDTQDGISMAGRYKTELGVLERIASDYAGWDPGELDGYPVDLLDILADAAIGSAAVCAMRCYEAISPNASAKLAFEFGHAFLDRMNTASSTLAVAAAMEGRGERTIHWKNMLAYGCEGNLQAMIDEYAHVCEPVRTELDGAGVLRKTHEAMVGEGDNPNCHLSETRHGVNVPNMGHASERIGTMPMRTNIAAAFMESRSSKEGKNIISRVRLRNAFNSPFRPFVLVSTSVGQEGLDFHSYCRKICHWNLPSNPIDLEQREGRVNRYKGLAVRQNVAARYGNMEFADGPIWPQMFKKADRDEFLRGGKEKASGLLPYWGVTDGADMVKVERYVYLYPFSRDVIRYKRLIADVYRYRAVLGMPDQEELLHMLEARIAAGDLTEDDLRGLFVNLCPYTWRDEGE